jgi:fructose-specific phosphotransferase system IIC component
MPETIPYMGTMLASKGGGPIEQYAITQMLGLMSSVRSSGTGATSTGINVNAGDAGATYLLLASRNTSAGDSTASAMYLVRCGYDGDHYSVAFIGGTDFLTFSLASSILQATNAGGGNTSVGIICNRSR